MRIVDTHCHLIYRDRLSYPWLSRVPPLQRDFTLAEYLPQARAAGITDILHMEVDVAEADLEAEARFAAGLGQGVIGTIAGCRPEAAGFAAFAERVGAIPGVKGFRRILHTQPDDLSRAPIFAENIRRLSGTGLTFDICVFPHQHHIAIDLVCACPDVQFVLDHCGNPDLKGGDLAAWRAGITAAAALPNLACKFSGIVTNAPSGGWTLDHLRPAAEHIIASFGWNRVVWGSDWPVLTLNGDLGGWLAAARALLADASADEQAAVFGGNALRIYRLG